MSKETMIKSLRSSLAVLCKRNKDGGQIKTVSVFTAYFFMINYVVGTGFLGIPFSFFHSGVLAGVLTLLAISAVSCVTAIWTVEAMARVQALETDKTEEQTSLDSNEVVPLLDSPKFEVVLGRKFEPTELCQVLFGKHVKRLYIIILTVYCFLVGWGFATVAGSAWASNIPFNTPSLRQCAFNDFNGRLTPADPTCLHSYMLCVAIFGVLMIVLAIPDLTEQKIIQLILGILRFVVMLCMILYSLVRLIQTRGISPNDCHDISPSVNTTQNHSSHLISTMFGFNGVGWLTAVPVFVYSQIIHQGIPSLTAPIRSKGRLHHFFMTIYGSTFLSYSLLGLFVALYWEAQTQETSTLNWVCLTEDHNVGLQILAYFIVIFPSLDVISAYPLNVVTIANNLYQVIFGRDADSDRGKKAYIIKLSLRLVCSILPLIPALFVANLVSVLQYAGLLGFSNCYLFPLLFQIGSQYKCLKTFGPTKSSEESSKRSHFYRSWWLTWKNKSYWTPYSSFYSHPIVVVVVGVLCAVLFLLTVASIPVSHLIHPAIK